MIPIKLSNTTTAGVYTIGLRCTGLFNITSCQQKPSSTSLSQPASLLGQICLIHRQIAKSFPNSNFNATYCTSKVCGKPGYTVHFFNSFVYIRPFILHQDMSKPCQTLVSIPVCGVILSTCLEPLVILELISAMFLSVQTHGILRGSLECMGLF